MGYTQYFCEHNSLRPTVKPDLKDNRVKVRGYMGAYSVQPAGVNALSLIWGDLMLPKPQHNRFGSDTLYLHTVRRCCQECVKVDLGWNIYTEA